MWTLTFSPDHDDAVSGSVSATWTDTGVSITCPPQRVADVTDIRGPQRTAFKAACAAYRDKRLAKLSGAQTAVAALEVAMNA